MLLIQTSVILTFLITGKQILLNKDLSSFGKIKYTNEFIDFCFIPGFFGKTMSHIKKKLLYY